MKPNYTHISMLLDRSGSMDSIKDFIIEGFNNFIKDQRKEPGEMTISLVQFDTDYEVLLDFARIHMTPNLNKSIYIPRGCTALNDSWVRLIEETGAKLSILKEEDRPEKVLCISLTDGMENGSRKYAGPEGNDFIKKLVESQERNYNWKFLYIGANQDSKKEAALKGIKNYANYKATRAGVGSTMSFLSTETSNYRGSLGNDLNIQQD